MRPSVGPGGALIVRRRCPHSRLQAFDAGLIAADRQALAAVQSEPVKRYLLLLIFPSRRQSRH
jgi:hypothetical protein